MKGHILLLGTLTLLLNCGGKEHQKTSNGSQSYAYSFEVNGCKTGEHKFSSSSELCDALQNNTLNKGCAEQMRAQLFNERCPERVFKTTSQSGMYVCPSVTVTASLTAALESGDEKQSISCASSIDEAIEMIQDEFMLISGSSMATASQKISQCPLESFDSSRLDGLAHASLNKITTLSAEEKLVVMSSPTSPLVISCSTNLEKMSSHSFNTYYLSAGSILVMKESLESQTNHRSQGYQAIICQ